MTRYIVGSIAFRTLKEAKEYSKVVISKGETNEKYYTIRKEKVVKRDNGEYWTCPRQESTIFTEIFGNDGEEVVLRRMIDGKLAYEERIA